MPTIAIARVMHEGNNFLPLLTPLVLTPLANFTVSECREGETAHATCRGTNTEMGGAID